MRVLVARCEVLYTGRLTARLPEAVRLIMFKADGSVLVHDDAGGYKPLNRSGRFSDRNRLGGRVPPVGELTDELRSFLGERRYAVLATHDLDGGIHLTPIWFLFEDDRFYVPSSSTSAER